MSNEIQALVESKAERDATAERARQQYEEARQRYEEASAGSAALGRVIAIMEARQPQPAARAAGPTASDIDFTGARNVVERLVRIADRSGGVINITKSAEIIIAAGLSRQRKENLRSSIYREVQGHPDWEKVSPGMFRHRNGQRPPP